MSGLIFGIGLLLSGMASPAKVISFLDITGSWDPSLIFVMIGALLISTISFRISKHMRKALCADQIQVPASKQVDLKLVLGSLLFGMGWGLAGFCPGPAIVAVGAFKFEALVFAASMVVGMIIVNLTNNKTF